AKQEDEPREDQGHGQERRFLDETAENHTLSCEEVADHPHHGSRRGVPGASLSPPGPRASHEKPTATVTKRATQPTQPTPTTVRRTRYEPSTPPDEPRRGRKHRRSGR